LKKIPKKENTWKIKRQNFKTEKKKRKQNKGGEKGTSKREKNIWEKVDLSICIYFAFSMCFCFAVILLFSFCLEKSQKTTK